MARGPLSSQALTGAIIVVVGVLLLLSTTGVYDAGELWRFVPSLFVLLGLWAIYRSGFRNLTGPILLVLAAGTIQLLALDLITGDTVATWWPLLVIAFGLAVLVGHRRQRQRAPAVTGDDFDLIGIFGGSEQRIASSNFRGGTATAAFGGVEVDLRDVELTERPAVVTATALFGGVELHVPETWQVSIDVLPIFGAVEDERPRFADVEPTETPDLVVTGFVAFGAVSIKD